MLRNGARIADARISAPERMVSDMERTYIIDNPQDPEPNGSRTYRDGTVRTVTNVNGTKVVSWDYSNSVY